MFNTNLTQLDVNQMIRRKFDAENDADRVMIVGGENFTVNADFSEVNKNLNDLIELYKSQNVENKNPFIIKETEIKEIQVPIVVKEIEIKEIKVPIFMDKIITIEKHIPITTIQYREIEKPVIIYKDVNNVSNPIPVWLKVCMIAQTLTMLGIMLIKLK